MAQFKVNKSYKDLEIGRVLNADEQVEMTVKRSEEVEKTLEKAGYKGPFLERIKEKK
ncbi:hypothetical protein [Staphylococcus shinii]|uniref:hypothetical protein n=1 Tax=Staphylococcus shinii TaxID=2912228 RepID=UPI003F554F0F